MGLIQLYFGRFVLYIYFWRRLELVTFLFVETTLETGFTEKTKIHLKLIKSYKAGNMVSHTAQTIIS